MKCNQCKTEIDTLTKLSFRAECPKCGIDLHTCTHCRYYAPGKPNDCLVPNTEFIRDREARNYCEEFRPKTDAGPAQDKGKFNSLFKD